MQNNLFYNHIKNDNVKKFIENIPSNIKLKCKIRIIKKGKIVVLKGNDIENIYISCQGKMQVRNEFENGFIYSFATINPIAYIGVMEVMANKQNYLSTIETSTDCIIVEIPKVDFIDWINNDQKLTLEVLHFISNSMCEQSIKTGEKLAYPAICILITYLMNFFESEDKDTAILEKTREEIGSILGFSIRTINRNLKILKEEKLISVNRKNISITKEQFNRLSYKLELMK